MQTVWGLLPAAYLFLGGLAGGTFLVGAVARLVRARGGWDAQNPTMLDGLVAWTSLGALAVGLALLVGDLDNPERALALTESFSNPRSVMAWGAWLLVAAMVVFGLNAVVCTPRLRAIAGEMWGSFRSFSQVISWALTALGAVLGLLVALYTGVLLMVARGVALWSSPLVPTLFTLSALGVGAVLVRAFLEIGYLRREAPDGALDRGLSVASLLLTACEACVLAVFVGCLLAGSPTSVAAVRVLLEGEGALGFWTCVVGAGLVVPIACDAVCAAARPYGTVARVSGVLGALGVLVGSFALRYLVLEAGVHAALIGVVL